MAKVVREVASFDIETDKAVKSINAYIDSLKKLEAQRKENIKLGKSTVAVNKQIDKTIDDINASLKQTTTTTKGQVAQLEAVRRAQKEISKDGQKQLGLLDKEEKKRKAISKSLRSQRRAFGELKFLAVGAAVGIVSALGQVGEAIDAVNDVLFPAIGLQNKVAEATKGAALEYVKEKAALDNKFEAVNAATVGTTDHRKAVEAITEQYGPYLSDLAKEELRLGNSARAQEEATNGILKRIVAQQKLAIAEKLIGQIVDSQTDSINRNAQANAGAGQILEDLTGGFAGFIGEATGLFDVSENVAKVGNELDRLKSESARKQLDLLAKGGDQVFIDFLKGFEDLSDIFGDFQEDVDKTTGGTEKTTKAVKDLSGTLAGLNKQLQDAKKVLTEGIQVTDREGLSEQQALINDLEARIKKLQDFLKTVGQEEEFQIKPLIDVIELDQSAVEASLRKGLQEIDIADLRGQIEGIEIKGLIDVEAIEDARNQALEIFRGTAEERDQLNEQFNNARLQREQQTARQILTLQLQILEAEKQIAATAGESIVEFDKKIAELNLQLTELDRQEVDVKVNVETEDAEAKIAKVSETIGFVTDGIQQLGSQIIGFFQQQTDAALNKLESDVARQQAFLDNLLSNQESANAQQVQLERDRLDNLVKEREKAVERQAALAQIEIAFNAAIAIAQAAAQGGVAAGITIAVTLLSLAIGFAQAKATASQAFAEGSDYVNRGKGEPSGTDTIHARLNEGEAVIQTDKNKEYHPAVKAIRRGSIDAKLLNDFVTNPDKYKEIAMEKSSGMMMPSLQARMDSQNITLNATQGGLSKKDADAMIQEMKEMKEMMSEIQVSKWNVKGNEFARVVTSVQDQKKRHGKRFR